MRNIQVWYHANCADGFGAALAMWTKYRDSADYVPLQYNQPIPPVDGDMSVYMVDFSFSAAQIRELAMTVASVTVIDHHKTAEAELQPLIDGELENVDCIFDTTKAGCVLTWGYLYHDKVAPLLLQHIADRDLWKFELEDTKPIALALRTMGFHFEAWFKLLTHPVALTQLAEDGRAMQRYHDSMVVQAVKSSQMVTFHGYTVPAVNTGGGLISDVGHTLAKDHPFAIMYFKIPGGWVLSLRSDGANAVDVSAIAKEYNGGGHKNAAGCSFIGQSIEDVLYFNTSSDE